MTAFVLTSIHLFAQNTNPWPATGSIGIGTTTPLGSLDVRGQALASGFEIYNTGTGTNNDNYITSVYGTSTQHLIGTYHGWDPLGVYIAAYNASIPGSTAVSQAVYIGNPTFNNNFMMVNLMTGAVGIGTTHINDGTNRLFVETGIRTRKVTVDQATWPDYVFRTGYRLPPLDGLARYIDANHHLPGVVNADSVAKNGLDLGANQAALLKKIEELTLYVIALDKKNTMLQKEVRRLKRSVFH